MLSVTLHRRFQQTPDRTMARHHLKDLPILPFTDNAQR
jgi:hypothetical protein